jgi:hypothetical protein
MRVSPVPKPGSIIFRATVLRAGLRDGNIPVLRVPEMKANLLLLMATWQLWLIDHG